MSLHIFHDALGSLVATALHRVTSGEQDWYDFTEVILNAEAEAEATLHAIQCTTKVADILPGAVFAHIPLATIVQSAEFRVMERLKDLFGPNRIVMLAIKSTPQGPRTINILTVYSVVAPGVVYEENAVVNLPEDQVDGAETQLPEAPTEPTIKPEYNHRRWPSPRAVRFAKALSADNWPWNTAPPRMTHVQALERLATHAGITVDVLRSMRPADYVAKHMGKRAQWALKAVYGSPYQF